MIEVSVLKYYGMGKHTDPVEAQKEVNVLKAKYPDRDYVILRNMRSGYDRYQVVQVATVTQEWPEADDLGPEPQPPLKTVGNRFPTFGQAWDDYRHELTRRRREIEKATQSLQDELRRKLNP